MNWDTQLSSIMSAADGSVAKMRERLATSPGRLPTGRQDSALVREVSGVSGLEPLPPLPPLPHPSCSLTPVLQWTDLAAVQSQLQLQSQAVESLSQRLRNMEAERQSQQRHLEELQGQVSRLRQGPGREREEERRSPEEESRVERWRREVGRELASLRTHVTRATSLGNLEESFSSKLRREELDQLRREVDNLKTQLRRQEEDMFLQQSESRETRRQYERSCQTLEELTSSYRTHSLDLAKTVSQYTHTQQEVQQLRVTVTELREEVRSLILRERHSPAAPKHTHTPALVSAPPPRRRVRGQEAEPDSGSEDFSPTPSLAEVSSDDLSWLDDQDPAPRHRRPRIHLGCRDRDLGVGSDDDEDNLELGSELSLDDL
ncbi:trichohyalin isoform X2 [Osmerus eperlanus]|uniref:trichohyalin isoform X2 n=1 Tax=Osmerus eperlanus TaxID=29151 RepID=UPI002E126D50